MKRLKANKRKLTPHYNTIDTKSRDIIISIFNHQHENDKLQYTKNRWRSHKKQETSQLVSRIDYNAQQPLKTILPVVKFIANNVQVRICSFIFVDGPSLQVAYKEQTIKFAKTKFQSAKLKYWLSHLYFFKLRSKLARDLLQKDQNTNRQTVHIFEQKEYLPGHLSGSVNNSAPLVRKLKISPEPNYRRHGQAEKKPFCVIHCKNGRQQVVSFSQALAFADYKFNLVDLVYIRILSDAHQNSSPILVTYLKKDQKQFEKQLIQKFKTIISRAQGWEYNKNANQTLKMQATNSKDFGTLARMLTLQMIAYIQTRHFVVVKRLQTQWILDKEQDLYLSNVWAFETSQSQQSMLTQGLATLYQKLQTEKVLMAPQKSCFKREISTRYKVFKSEEKYRNSTDLSQLPVVSGSKQFQTPTRLKTKSNTKLRTKGKSCIFRNPLKLQE